MGVYLGISSTVVGVYGLLSGAPLWGAGFLASGVLLVLFFKTTGVHRT
jgi:hypothetical protein